MRAIRREVWTYAILLLILFALAAVSVSQVIRYLSEYLSDHQFHVVATLVWVLTFGFMFLAGAFGIWTIQFLTELEERRRLARLVEAMDLLRDGFYVLDGDGRIVGLNAAARKQVKGPINEGDLFAQAFDRLSPHILRQAIESRELIELEDSWADPEVGPRYCRIRSQPAGSLRFVMVSDVTSLNLQRRHSRAKARLQLLGELARGVTHDFSSLLTSISGYASALARVPRPSPEFDRTLREVVRDADRGLALAEQLFALAQQGTAGAPTDLVSEHMRAGCESLRDMLPTGWDVVYSGEGRYPTVALSGLQIEQLVANLGSLVAEGCRQPSTVSVTLTPPKADSPMSEAATLVVHGPASLHEAVGQAFRPSSPHTPAGVIQSVLRSMVEEAGGSLESASVEGVPCFRVRLPKGNVHPRPTPFAIPPSLAQRVAGWSVFLATPHSAALHDRLAQLGVSVNTAPDLVSTLAFVERDEAIDVLVVDHHLLRHEVIGLLRAIRKLRPHAGVVVLCETVDLSDRTPLHGVVFALRHESPDVLINHMVEAYEMASPTAAGETPNGGTT
jgi:signal transduction histidine kinase/CheY-like chemotaxis protein